MTTSIAQIAANQLNAQKSTGPVTEIGKSRVATNAIKHGLFSKNLILANECSIEYQNLLDQLQAELAPSGIFEQTIVERIAINLWRQKRLIRAESAHIELSCQPKNIVAAVNHKLSLNCKDAQPISEEDLKELDVEHYHWCVAALEEYKIIASTPFDIATLKKHAPLIFQRLLADADGEDQILEFLDGYDNYFTDIAHGCRVQIKQAKERPLILEIAQLVRDKRAILKNKLRDSLTKHRVMLDNELYKAIKALREAQEYRFKTLTVIPE